MRLALVLLCGCSLQRGGLDTAGDFVDATVAVETAVAETIAVAPDVESEAMLDVYAAESSAEASLDSDSGADSGVDAPTRCDEPGAVRAEGHCYFLLTGPFDFGKARDACNGRMPPAHLASITSAAEQTVVAARGSGDRWIGLIKDPGAAIAKASFRWITGELSTVYDNWSPGDPNGGHNCARMGSGGQWLDINCTTPYPAICERD